jgi:hypothetical protein
MFTINEKCLNSNKCDESNFYKYSGLDKLDKLDDTLKSNSKVDNFYICGYRVNNNELYPFLDFLLKNDTNELLFPCLKTNGTLLLSKIQNLSNIKELLNLALYNIIYDDKYEYKGIYHYKNNIYIFFDFTNCKLIINNTHKNSIVWSVLVDEIINKKHICNIKVNSDVINFFNENMDFLFLKDENEKIYEIPSVVYVGKEISKINFTYIFGLSKPDSNLLFGPYYYFTNFKNAIKQGGWNEVKNDKNIKGGIVRFALFTGSTKVILNKMSDSIDKSEIKTYLTSTNKLNNLYENLTLRITDYDGKWAKKYDSIYVGDIELDNGEKMKNTPIYVVKKYEQHIPLSYHFIDKRLLDKNFDPNKDYQIM